MGVQQQEAVALQPPGDGAVLGSHALEMPPDQPDHLVAEIAAPQLVDHVEMVDVKDHGVHGPTGIVQLELLAVVVEELPAVQVRHLVLFGGGDDVAVLRQLDGPGDARHHDLRHAEGLRDEVRRAHAQGRHLRRLLARQHHHGDALELRVGLQHLQQLIARHHGHVQVQQHHGQRVGVGADQLETLPAVLRVQQMEVVLQHHAEDLAVDLLVLHHQHLTFAVGRVEPSEVLIHTSEPPCGAASAAH